MEDDDWELQQAILASLEEPSQEEDNARKRPTPESSDEGRNRKSTKQSDDALAAASAGSSEAGARFDAVSSRNNSAAPVAAHAGPSQAAVNAHAASAQPASAPRPPPASQPPPTLTAQPPAASAAAGAQGGQGLADALAAAMQSLLAAANNANAGGGASAGAASSSAGAAANAAPAPRSQPRARRSGAGGRAAPRVPTLPPWVLSALVWLQPPAPQPGSCPLLDGSPDESSALLTQLLGCPVEVTERTGPPANADAIKVIASGGAVARSAAALAVSHSCASRRIGTQEPVAVLAATHARCAAQPPSEFTRFWASTVAAAVLKLLADDVQDDLYFEGGKVRLRFLQLFAAGAVGGALVEDMLEASGEAHTQLWEELLQSAFFAFKDFSFVDALQTLEGKLSVLAALTSVPKLVGALAARLLREVLMANGVAAGVSQHRATLQALPAPVKPRAFEAQSILAPLLSVSCMTDISRAARAPPGASAEGAGPACLQDVRGYPANRGGAEPQLRAMEHVMTRAQAAAHAILKRVAQLKPPAAGAVAGGGKEIVLAWLAAVCTLSEGRLAGGEKGVLQDGNLDRGCSDALMLGVTSVALRFLAPVLDKFDRNAADVEALVAADRLWDAPHRLGSLASEPVLGRRADAAPLSRSACAERQEASGVHSLSVTIAEGDHVSPHFVTECYIVATRAIHVGLLPAVHRHEGFIQNRYRMLGTQGGGRPPAGSLEDRELAFITTHADCNATALLQDDTAMAAVRYLALTLHGLLAALQAPDAAARTARFPESLLRDAINFAAFAVNSGAMDLLGSVKQLGACMAAMAQTLQSPAVHSAMAHSSVVDLLSAMLRSQHAARGSHSLAAPRLRPGAAALVEAVLRTVSSAGVVPALMTAYTNASVVEGLDVDKYHFDKFTMRHTIDRILEELWKDAQCREDLVAMAASDGPRGQLLQSFLKALLDDLSYLLDDAMDRIADIKTITEAQKDVAAWDALSASEREDKEAFKAGQISTGRGFLGMAITTLRMLTFVAEHPTIGGVFLRGTLTAHAAHLCLERLEKLLGPQAAAFALENAAEMRWRPDEVMTDIVRLLLQLARQPAFVQVLALDQDYNPAVMQTALERIREREASLHLAGRLGDRLEQLLAQAEALRGTAAAPAANSVEAALALTFEGEAPPLESSSPAASAAADELEAAYKAELAPFVFGTFDAGAAAAYNSELLQRSAQVAHDTPAKMKRLAREFRALGSGRDLPLGAAAAIFVRHDENRVDMVRALITGPQGTPYAGGCFFFDVLFPGDYPNAAPLMLFETTGQGRVRFNPNLYADGKVCLSLLGTFHGATDEKWDPAKSSLYQVLVSIQAMIFVEDPYFNEPNVERMRFQPEGVAMSRARNAALQLDTIRWAMIEVLRRPRPGFEAAVAAHFRLLRGTVLRQTQRWLAEGADQGELWQQRMAAAIGELRGLLAAL